MRIAITGGAGFMGSWLAGSLIKAGHYVCVLDDLSGGYERNIPDGAERFIFNLQDAEKTQEVISGLHPEVIFHLACSPHEGLSQFMPMSIASSVLDVSLSVFTAAIKSGVRRVVNFSSMARYGDAGGRGAPFAEWDPCTPKDVYGAAKLAAEHSLQALCEAHGMERVTLVPHNVVGARQNLADPMRNVLAIWVNLLMQDKPFYIYGDGKQTRALSDIRDSLPCYLVAGLAENDMLSDPLDKQVINIGASRAYSLNELADMVLEAFGGGPRPIHVEGRPCEVKFAHCTVTRSEERLGFIEEHSLPTTIKDFVAWAKTMGPQEPVYPDAYEITSNMPKVWKEKLI